MRVAAIQCDLLWEDPGGNRLRLLPRIESAVAAGARLVALPETFPTGFSMDAARVAEPEGGPSERFLAETAGRFGAALAGSVVQRRGREARARNVLLLAGPDGDVRRYAKIHPFGHGGEAAVYEGGDELPTWEFEGLRITPQVCYDLRFPEVFALAAARTDLFLVVANWPASRAAHWETLLAARAVETQAYVLGVNRVGQGGGHVYDGRSRLYSPWGDRLAAGPTGEEAVVAGEVDPGEVARVRERFPFLADRRPALYRRLASS